MASWCRFCAISSPAVGGTVLGHSQVCTQDPQFPKDLWSEEPKPLLWQTHSNDEKTTPWRVMLIQPWEKDRMTSSLLNMSPLNSVALRIKMIPEVKTLAASTAPRTIHGGDIWPRRVVQAIVWSPHMLHGTWACMCVRTHTHLILERKRFKHLNFEGYLQTHSKGIWRSQWALLAM